MPRSEGIGAAVARAEDGRLLTGAGRFSDDVNLPGQAYAVMLRSPHAHARIGAIDARAALAAKGVLAVLTGQDALADGLRAIPHSHFPQHPPDVRLANRDGSAIFAAPHYVLPADRARFVGEGVVMVVAESVREAKDAAELVEVDYEELPSVTDTVAAAAAGAPRVWDEVASNVCIDADIGDAAATDAAFASAKHVARLKTWVGRTTAAPIEPRAAVGDYDRATGRHALHAGSGGVLRQRRELAAILNVAPDSVRVTSGDVGGNFGSRNPFYPEFALVVWAAKRLGRPVKWTCERSESFLSDHQGRDVAAEAELALDGEGRILGFRAALIGNVGAHAVSFTPITKTVEMLTSVYHVPAAHCRVKAVLSNTPPTASYRSSGRPEAMFVIERLLDLAAREHGFDRTALRRRNLVASAAMPYGTALGLTYDSGDYAKAFDAALRLGAWESFAARRADAKRRGRLRGIGVANYIEIASGDLRERAVMTVHPERRVDIAIGTLSSGQGHETSFAQVAVEWLGVPHECVRVVTGDTAQVEAGGGSHAGRSMRLAGIVIAKAADGVIAQGRRIAAAALEADERDLEFSGGVFRVKGTDRALTLFEAAAREPLSARADEAAGAAAFPYGAQVTEVEVDPETGTVTLAACASVDDVGRAINPLILHGQAHGSIAQGMGQALFEQCRYDPATGQLLSGSFQDYCIPRADTMPSFATEIQETPSPNNPLGIRAGGEGATAPALASLVNAVVDALAGSGVTHLEMPVTAERVWRALNRNPGGS